MDEGFESLLSTPALEALISVNGDEKQLNPEIQKEILNAKLAVFDAQQASLDEQIASVEATRTPLVKAAESIYPIAKGAASAGFSGLMGYTAAPAGRVASSLAAQEAGDVMDAFIESGANAVDRTFSPNAPQTGSLVGDFTTQLDKNRESNILGDPREYDLGSVAEFGLGMLGGGKVSEATDLAKKELSSVVGELPEQLSKKPEEVIDIINKSGQQLASGDFTPITSAFKVSPKDVENIYNPLSSGTGTVGDKVAELFPIVFRDTKNFPAVKSKAAEVFGELGAARAAMVKDLPFQNISNDVVNSNPDLFLGIAAQVEEAAKRGLPDAQKLLPTITKMIDGAPVTGEEFLTLGQKLAGLGYKTSSDELGRINPELFKSAAESINSAVKGSLKQLPDGAGLISSWDELTDSMNALKWIEGAAQRATSKTSTLAAKTGEQALMYTPKEESMLGKMFGVFNKAKYQQLPDIRTPAVNPGNIEGAQLLPEVSLGRLQRELGASQAPISMPADMAFEQSLPYFASAGVMGDQANVAVDDFQRGVVPSLVGDATPAGYKSNAMNLGLIPSITDYAKTTNFGISDANAAQNIDAALNMGMPQTPDQMSLDGGLLAPQEFGDPLLEGVNTEDFYADKINIPDTLGEVVGKKQEAKQTPTLERTAASVMDYVSKVDPDMSGIPKDSLDAVKALLSGSVEDQRAGVYELVKAAPSLFGSSKIPGIDSLVDGVIIDPDERVKATQKLAKVLDGDPVRKIEVINKIRREEPLPSWAYKYMGGEEQKSFEDTFLEQQEGFKSKAYLDTRGNPTIGMGVNLAAFDVKSLRDTGISENIISKVLPLLGAKGEVAKQRIKDFPVSLDENEALELSKAIKQASKETLESQYKTETGASLEDLPVQARTVMLSLAYNFGDIKKKLPTFWDYATMGRWDEASNFLEKQTWKQPELTARRQKEAALLKELSPDTIQLAANVGYDDDATNGMVDLEDGEKTQTYKF